MTEQTADLNLSPDEYIFVQEKKKETSKFCTSPVLLSINLWLKYLTYTWFFTLYKYAWGNTMDVWRDLYSINEYLLHHQACLPTEQLCMVRSFAKWCRNNGKHSNIHGGSPTSLRLALLAASLNLIWARSGPPKCFELQMIHKDFYSEHQLTVKISCIQEKIGKRWVTARQIIHTLPSLHILWAC